VPAAIPSPPGGTFRLWERSRVRVIFARSGKTIIPLTVKEILDEEIVRVV
jgi:hypothetical protein